MILGEMCKFYENLYDSKQTTNSEELQDYIRESKPSKLSNQDQKFCEYFPTIEECTEAVKNMKNNKSPGLDGIPPEFYKFFWGKIHFK